MDNKHPKRKKDKYNPYVLYHKNGTYFISFADSRGKLQTLEIEEELYLLFNQYELEDISHLNKVSLHIEHSELTETTLNERAFEKAGNLEETVLKLIEHDLLYKEISKLPDVQRRRLFMYYFENMTFEEIAEIEGCTYQAVQDSIYSAIKKLLKKLK